MQSNLLKEKQIKNSMSIKNGVMIILSSPSGAGKTTLVKLLSEKKKYKISISHTTRKPRLNEKDNIDYYFVDENHFKKLIKTNEFLEFAKVFNNFYGTSKTQVLEYLTKDQNVIFDIDWQGTEQIKKQKLNFKLITFFILPPSKEVLFQRLSNRDMKDKLIASERMKEFKKDLLHWEDYDYVVINDVLDECYSQIENIINAEINNSKIDYDKEKIRRHVEKLAS